MKKGKPQAKDLDDAVVLSKVLMLSMDPGSWNWPTPHWVCAWDLAAEFPLVPDKVVRAKCATLIRRRLLDGCACGCRGDYHLTDAGTELLRAKLTRDLYGASAAT